MKKIIYGIGMSLLVLVSVGCQSKETNTNVDSKCLDIKGNTTTYDGEKIYHMPGGAYYDRTIPEETFCTEEEAQAAGYRRSMR
jgi:hypothetical protein